MKKITFLAASAMLAMGANAQYNVEPEASVVLGKGTPAVVDVVVLDAQSVSAFEQAGATVNQIGPDNETRNLWYWAGFNPGDDTYPGVGMHFDGYVSVNVTGDAGWSGAGFACAAPSSVNIAHFTEDTHFHLAYRTATTAPASVALILCDAGAAAKVALGTSFDDNGTVFPAVGAALGEEWQGLDITFAQLKKIWPAFDWTKTEEGATREAWTGNILSFLAGNAAGSNVSFDAIYFYTPTNAGAVEGVAVDEVVFVVTENTINVNGAQSIELYDFTGKTVKSVNSSVMGINDVAKGVYIAKAGNAVKKIMVK